MDQVDLLKLQELDHLSCQLTAENVGVAGRIVYEAQRES